MYAIDIKDKNTAVLRLMQHYASDRSLISIEGYELINSFGKFEGCDIQETETLLRQTTWPKLNFYVLPLTENNVSAIFNEIQSKELLYYEEGIIHIQIAKDNERVFYGCDFLDPDCTVASGQIQKDFLEKLLDEGIISAYEDRSTVT